MPSLFCTPLYGFVLYLCFHSSTHSYGLAHKGEESLLEVLLARENIYEDRAIKLDEML